MNILIFLFYTVLFIFILYRFSLNSSFKLTFKESFFVLIIKIAAGCFYGYFFLHYYGGDDTWLYHNEGLKEYALLKTDVIQFLKDGITNGSYKANQLITVFSSSDSFIKDLELLLLFKLLAIFDLLSGGNYYVNVIFYNTLVFWGGYYLFATVCKKYPEKRKLWLLFIFYFPPLLFWTSGVRKDGLTFAIFCGLIYQLFYLFEIKRSLKHIVYACLLFLILFLIRNYVAMVFIPVATAYVLSKKYRRYSLPIFIAVSIVCVIGFFATTTLPEHFNLPLKMAERQHAFLQLSGNSYLPIDSLNASASSYTRILPQAIDHVFVRPYYSEARGILYIFSFFEVLFFFFLLIRMIVKPSADFRQLLREPLVLSFLMIALFNYIIIGYTVPFLGAIVRYKASFEILFILAFIALQNVSFTSFNPRTKKSPANARL